MSKAITRRDAHKLLLGTAMTAATAGSALRAQGTYPSRTVQIVVPYPAGGTTDVVARALAMGLGKLSSFPVIVENRPGASSTIGAGVVARAQPDGHTLLVTTGSTATLLPHTLAMNFDPLKTLTAVAEVSRTPLFLYANPELPAKDLKGLVGWMKANPGRISYGSYGQGTAGHFGGVLLERAAGVQMLHVPFQGGAPALQALIGGHVQLLVDAYQPGMEQVKTGKVLALAVSSPERSPYAPAVPTFRELGFQEVEFISGFFGLFAPSGTPRDVVERLNAMVSEVARSADFQSALPRLGVLPPRPLKSPELQASIQRDNAAWAKLVKDIGYRRGDG
jgi:tripartite-type tricarboxylate transporter receptor subunit TctC